MCFNISPQRYLEIIVTPEELTGVLRERISDFGERPSYVLFPEELAIGKQHNLFVIQKEEDRGDGTIITEIIFEGKKFLCATEATKAATK